jgi:hypothetical protein
MKRRRHASEDDAKRYWHLRMVVECVKLAIWTVLEALHDGNVPL